jgi:hypothetical protein
MSVILKNKVRLAVPRDIVRKADLKPDDKDEYTPAQRRAILADARAGLKEIAQGKGYGPFQTGAELRIFVESAIRNEDAQKLKRKAK